jgi:DNA-binding beta-propeller fold protein YncE
VVVDSGGTVYVADYNNHRVRKIAGGQVSTLAGSAAGFLDGAASTAMFNHPLGVALGPAGAVYVSDNSNNRIRVVSGSTVSTLTGSTAGYQDGTLAQARFDGPGRIAVDASGFIYLAEINTQRVRLIKP